jgi:lysophospholipase L1-like esterase
MSNKPLSKGRLGWFRVIAVLLPIVVLLVAELLLRLFHYGHDTSLFIRYPDNPDYWVMNKFAAERYFSDTVNETRGSIEPFRVEKSANTFRIFVLGESTTAGYPYFHNGSFHRWLTYRLMREYPDIHFEVVNVSLTAVNSYTVLDFGKQVVHYQPDVVLVYAGHNEYYGALGIGSTSHLAHQRWLVLVLLELRKLRLVQLVEHVVASFRPGDAPDERENLMQRMTARQRIGFGSDDYYAGIRQYRDNMDALCRVMRDAGVPIFMSTLVSNERDQRPFISDSMGGEVAGGVSGSGISGGRVMAASRAFELGDSAYAAENYSLAKQYYVQAKELDLLRFRAPEAMNGVIVELAGKYPGVHLVDAKLLFETYSPHSILGRETLLEHVHPNLFGYALLSEAFYQSMRRANLFGGRPAEELSFADLLQQMPITGVDSLNGVYTIMMLKTRWPFDEPLPAGFKRGSSVEEQLAGALAVGRISWMDAMNQLFQYSQRTGDKRMAERAVAAVTLEYPDNATYKIFAGRLCLELGDRKGADFYFRQMRR